MRILKPNRRGILVPTKQTIPNITASLYSQPSQILKRIDGLRIGQAPKIAITRTQGGMGDVLMTLPTVKAIANKYKISIDYGTDFEYLEGALPKVLYGHPDIKNVIPWREIQTSDYDGVIDLTCPCVYHEKPHAVPVNRIDLFAKHAGVFPLKDVTLDYAFQPGELEAAQQMIEESQIGKRKIILVQPFSSASQRDAPTETIQKVLAQLLMKRRDLKAIVFTHGSDNYTTEWGFADILELRDWDVRKITAVMNFCDLVLCPDSSILHLAGALGKKTVSLFGPTDPNARINYYPEAVAIWAGQDLSCSPCVVEESFVLTHDGYKEIKDIQIGDNVKTQSGQLHKVTKLHKNLRRDRELYDITVVGKNEPITITEDHKMLASLQYMDVFRSSKYETNPEWIPAKELKERDFLCIPRNKFVENLPFKEDFRKERCWFHGLYMAEGYLKGPTANSRGYETILTIGGDEQELLKDIRNVLAKAFDIHVFQVEKNSKGNSLVVKVSNKALFNEIKALFGIKTRAPTKKIPTCYFRCKDEDLEAFLDGYFEGDGYRDKKNRVYSTASKQIAYGLQEIYTRFGKYVHVYKRVRDTNFKKNSIIYRIYVSEDKDFSRSLADDNFIYTPISKIEISSRKDEYVYDITVDKDTTFTISNLATWDCWYQPCKVSHTCWKRLEVDLTIDTIEAMLNDELLPSDPHLVNFFKEAVKEKRYEVL